MIIGERLRAIREHKNLTQGDIENRSGLLRCYISRVENGHTVPAVETLEKLARALEMPLYQVLYEESQPITNRAPTEWRRNKKEAWGDFGRDARTLNKLRIFLGRMSAADRQMLMDFAQNLVRRKQAKLMRRTTH
jgi:transcriptional regulator with XRE-family HTH domain